MLRFVCSKRAFATPSSTTCGAKPYLTQSWLACGTLQLWPFTTWRPTLSRSWARTGRRTATKSFSKSPDPEHLGVPIQ